MHNVVSRLVRSVMLISFVLFSSTLMSDPVYANGSNKSCSVHHEWFFTKITCHKAGNRDLPDIFNTESEGNFPSVCDGQVGYWTQIPMPGGKVFCVLHFTEFFKGGTYTDGGTTPTCTTTKATFVWWHKLGSHSYTKDGSCPTHTWKKPPV